MKIDEKLEIGLVRRELGLRLANRRILAQIKQSELAARCGISRGCLSRIENGTGGVSLNSVLEVFRQLGLLPALDSALPEPTIPLHELVQKEKRAQIVLPVRVRDRKRQLSAGHLRHKWGDEQ